MILNEREKAQRDRMAKVLAFPVFDRSRDAPTDGEGIGLMVTDDGEVVREVVSATVKVEIGHMVDSSHRQSDDGV